MPLPERFTFLQVPPSIDSVLDSRLTTIPHLTLEQFQDLHDYLTFMPDVPFESPFDHQAEQVLRALLPTIDIQASRVHARKSLLAYLCRVYAKNKRLLGVSLAGDVNCLELPKLQDCSTEKTFVDEAVSDVSHSTALEADFVAKQSDSLPLECLSTTCELILLEMLNLGAKDHESRKTTADIARAMKADANSLKSSVARLSKMKLVGTSRKPGGGCWLTPSGAQCAERLAEARSPGRAEG